MEEQIKLAAQLMGRKGGKSRSDRKLAAVRENGKLGGRPQGAKDKKPRKSRLPARALNYDPDFSQE